MYHLDVHTQGWEKLDVIIKLFNDDKLELHFSHIYNPPKVLKQKKIKESVAASPKSVDLPGKRFEYLYSPKASSPFYALGSNPRGIDDILEAGETIHGVDNVHKVHT